MTKENEQRAKIFQQAMQACHSNNPIDCFEWFAERIIELEKEKKKLLESVEGATAMYKDLQEARMRIERLKNCANCRQCSASHAGYPYWCLGREIEVTGYDRCNDWEEEK